MEPEKILDRAIAGQFLTAEEGLYLYEQVPLADLMAAAHLLRKKLVPGNEVGWIIDRNVNLTNVCISGCKFCNFSRKPGDPCSYVTSRDDYNLKIQELFALGGRQILLQGGMHPELTLDFYTALFRDLKKDWPELRLHALGPAEVVYLAKVEDMSYREVLGFLVEAGLDSLPGAGAEILSDRVRKLVSPGKCTAVEWLNVMREAHQMNLPTSATMMFGHLETMQERIEHLVKLREVQAACPPGNHGFITFIPWPFQDEDSVLARTMGVRNNTNSQDYLRIIAISRLMMPNILNIQASWLTVGAEVAQLCLHAGANDLGSVMIEENVVSAAGAHYTMNSSEMQQTILGAGFIPRYRNQKYQTEELPQAVVRITSIA
jgi:cyclic dehypoxanthinyl futalosine synthase